MEKRRKKDLCAAIVLLAAFALWTVAVCLIDVRDVGPLGSRVGLATLNEAFHQLTGVHMLAYTVTDWLGLVPLCVVAGFAVLGLAQWIRRKSLLKVDRDILMLGAFYLAVAAAYLFFEQVVINYRPVLIEGRIEASYPSSTTVLVLCVMLTAVIQLRLRVRSRRIRLCAASVSEAFAAFMTVGRLASGVHWLTDVVGGALLSVGLVMLYRFFVGPEQARDR